MDKAEEKSILLRFRENYSHFPIGRIIETDKPDFIVEGEKKIGIEITQVFKDQDSDSGSFLRSKETFQRNILENIKFQLAAGNFPFCLVSVCISDDFYSKKIDPRKIAFKCAGEIIKRLKNQSPNGYFVLVNEGQFPDIIESCSFWFDPSLKEIDYVETTGAVAVPLSNKFIQFILDKKEKAKLKFESCDFYWLIIKEGSYSADFFSTITVEPSELTTTFDRVFIIRQSNSQIIEVL